jgi:hypothetical protein
MMILGFLGLGWLAYGNHALRVINRSKNFTNSQKGRFPAVAPGPAKDRRAGGRRSNVLDHIMRRKGDKKFQRPSVRVAVPQGHGGHLDDVDERVFLLAGRRAACHAFGLGGADMIDGKDILIWSIWTRIRFSCCQEKPRGHSGCIISASLTLNGET